MFFRVVDKDRLPDLVSGLAREYQMIGPIDKGDKFVLGEFADFSELRLDYDTTLLPPKKWFFPPEETMMRFRVADNEVVDDDIYVKPRVILGLHACDINGLALMDNVFLGRFEDPYYKAHRENTLIIGHSCKPTETCFCDAWGTDEVHWGFDLFFTDLGEDYFVSVTSVKGAELLDRHVESREVTDQDLSRFQKVNDEFKASFSGEQVETSQLPLLLDAKFDDPMWERLGDKCLSCGACSMVCPTCYCFDVKDSMEADQQYGSRVRVWDSCQFKEFSAVAGGQTFRESRASRIKYRYYHKQWGYLSKFERVLCVGCGRCSRACKVGINPREVIRELQQEVPVR